MSRCKKCNGTGVIETGNNDLPCDCPAGDKALFNNAEVKGAVTGAEVRRHFLNGSPEPIAVGRERISASSLPGRQLEVYLDELQQEAKRLLALIDNRKPQTIEWKKALFESIGNMHGLTYWH